MLKKYDEALSEMQKESETSDSTRGCNVFKVLKDDDSDYYDDYGEPAKEPRGYFKRKARKAEKAEVAEYHKLHLFNDGLPSKDTQYDYTKDVEEKAKQEVAAGGLEGTSTARASAQDTTTGDGEPVQQTRTSGGKPVQETTTADKKPVPQTTATDKKPVPQTTTTDEEPVTDDADKEKDMIESYTQDKFRDAVRRIDMVLVAADDDELPVREVVTFYLQNVLKAGLHIETSPGVMPIHRNLLFIKVHAPDSVLDEHNHAFGTKTYFRDDHLRFVQPGLSFYGRLLPFARVTHERELISLVRDQYEEPLRLSNEERSLIVYKILLQLPFGNSVNMIGLNKEKERPHRCSKYADGAESQLRAVNVTSFDSEHAVKLIDRRILLDAYALHDGPHFIPRNQDPNAITARQVCIIIS
ncbi:hypothetical protein MSG28_003782 [Choristoneura fumiferana]|uniref:Uncharacterized protein n=1 Tax=Choristoneura fumiferana TaxID=7141 RepID=A0ACC0KGW6_CHOFU|nr:hypothetical protein MSG28_003782 [Choristoneura fumiferana]